ncbi:hypothetical protein SmJEL517_g05624 [Synchytrium microbalum]|uniref:Transmembrane protein 198 n=1 Tax=Synchytrium microbalum TaxID=1806994 RepID=A0A507BYR2_9FUNG|nr:uncharacterized protein SmJEL517_g05624 [Synchytrium microbalum]TPX30944.1 hypothetical protein SmJEL517_g05624 [Synchytrium microbalum]
MSTTVDTAIATTQNLYAQVTAQSSVLAILLIVTGLFLTFYGYRLFTPVLFVIGAYVGGLLAYIIVLNTEPAGGFANRDTLILVVVLVAALVVGCLTICLWRVGIALLGAALGFVLGLFILSWASGGVIASGLGRAIFLSVLSIIGGIAISILQKPIIIVATAVVGSYAFISGVDIFANTGFSLAAQQMINAHNSLNLSPFQTSPRMFAMLIGFMAAAIVGILFQFRATKSFTWSQPRGFVRSVGKA